MSNKTFNLASIWEVAKVKGMHASEKMSFGELRKKLKEFKDENELSDSDTVNFLLFTVKSDNERAPKYHLIIKKDNYKE